MTPKIISKSSLCALLLPTMVLLTAIGARATSITLEGQNKGDTNTWSSGNLQNWQELDYIPCRIHWASAQGNNQVVELDFEHVNGGVPGIQNLFNFSTSPNVVFVSPPVLSSPAGAKTWFYTFTINILDNQPAFVYFQSRLAAGAHLNVGSSLAISGKPSSMGNLQIHKPAPGPGTPDLMVLKTGPANAKPGDVITYTLNYTNQTTGFNPATGVQLSDMLPPEVSVLTNTIPAGGIQVGNTLYWDLPNLPLGVGGRIVFQAQILPGTGNGVNVVNTAQILSAENDLNYSDNTSTWTTTTASCSPPVVINGPANSTNCVGTTATFTVNASGTSLNYQWYNGTNALAGQSGSSLVLNNVAVGDAGTYSVVVTGACGTPITNSASLTVPPLPVITCSLNKSAEFGAAWAFDLPTANYPFVESGTTTNTAGHCGVTFDTTRTWVATDDCGNSVQCSQTVNVVDTTPPVIMCSNTNKTVEQGAAWDFDAPTATDNSGSATITVVSTVTNVTGHCGSTFDATRTWQATDACGNSSTCSQKVTIVDTTAPVIACSNTNKTVEQGETWDFDAPTATDNSGSNTITVVSTVTNVTGHCGSTFDATRTWQAVDGCGNSSTCSQTVTIVDTTAPVITCSNTNKTVEQGTAWSFDAPTATDNSGSNTITVVSTVTNVTGNCGSTFDATRTWQATDACGNSGTCSQKVTIVDTTAPVITCSNTNKTVEQGAAWSFDAPTATDNSGSNTITVVSTVTNVTGHCGSTFDAIRTWQATDACGNSSTCSQKVTIVDTTAPVITCSNTNKTVEQGAAWSFDAPTATDNSGSSTISVVSTVTNVTGHCGSTFDATRTWQATDACGNSSTCSQKVTIVDTTVPVITCSNTNKTVEQGAAWSFDAPTATDNSGSNTITVVSTVTNVSGHCGSTFDATRTWQSTDACGNSSTCSQKVTIVDTTVPVITCSNTNKTVEQGAAWSFDAPTATDNSGSNTITVVSTVTNVTGHCGSTFDATRTWQATDACGNSSTCSQKVTIVDTTVPVITCSNTNKTVEQGAAWSFDAPTATDNSGSNTITVVSTVTNVTGHCGSTFDATRTWQATDACGNSSTCSQKVTIVDTTAPVITCSNTNKTVEQGAAWSFDAPTATDNSGSNTITVVSTVTNVTGHCGSTFDATRTWQATDACGNSSTCSQKVTIVDTTVPVITCSNTNKTVEQGAAWSFDAPTATDNSGSNTISVVGTVTNVTGHCGTTFDATRTWQATDACGNSSTCSQKVTIVDTTAPLITCSNTNKTVEQGAAWSFDAPTATDNSGSNTITVVSTVTNVTGHCGTTFDATRRWQATDACGNFSQCTQKVTVQDTTAPVITCSNTNKTVEQGTAWSFDAPTAADNSGSSTITVVSTVTNVTGHCGSTFDATRTWQATDACGNTSTCSQKVTIVDTTAPVITCSNTNKTVEQGAAWSFDAPTATDNSGSNTITIVSTVTNVTGHCGSTFDATRTWQATDACGNFARCSQKVTIVDTTAPVITCSNTNKTVEQGAAWSFDAPTATDNSGSNTITVVSTVTNVTGHCGSTFDATRTWQATDACGNFARCSQKVTIVDTTVPVITCSNTNKIVEQGASWSFDAPTATDNSGSNTITVVSTVTNVTGHCGSTFDATRTWQATDACGNSSTCSQKVTIVDTTVPVITCSNTNKTVEQGASWSFDAPTATDNSGSNTITVVSTVTNVTGHCGSTFDATRTWQATDACGNSSTCSQKVTIVDSTAPVITCSNTNKTVEQGASWSFDAPTATDNSGSNTITVVSTVTNLTGHCGSTFDATRTWQATDACGNFARCSQKVTIVDTTAPVITCSNNNKTVQCGTAWTFDAPTATDNSGTSTITIASTITNASCGNTFSAMRTWKATDACGNSAQCSQTVTVVDITPPTITCAANKNAQTGSAWSFDTPTATDTCSAVTISILSTVTNTTCGGSFTATRTWVATDGCGNSAQCSQTVNVGDTTPPTVTIMEPASGEFFIAPAAFTIVADAQDPNGAVAKVEFFLGGTKLGEDTNGAPYMFSVTNLPAGSNYVLTAVATDACGNSSTSVSVNVTVLDYPPLSIIRAMAFNPQTGLFDQIVRVFNPTRFSFDAVRVLVYGLTNGATLYNASGVTTNGIPYVQSLGPSASGSYVDFVFEYYVPSRVMPTPTLVPQLTAPSGHSSASGVQQHIDRGVLLPDKTFLIEFTSVSNSLYAIQYTKDLKNWETAYPSIRGNGTRVQWIDNGEPKTESAPLTTTMRFYRLLLLP